MPQFHVTYDRGVPELCTKLENTPGIERLYAAEMDAYNGIYRYPWYWPFHWHVKHDIGIVFPEDATYSEGAQQEEQRQQYLFECFRDRKYPIELPEDFFRFQPYEHQFEGMLLALTTPRCGWIYSRGTGKTKTALDTIRVQKLQKGTFRTLVITPPVTIPNWQDEADMHSFGALDTRVFIGPKRAKALDPNVDVVLTSYETMREHFKTLAAFGFHCVVADESQRLRNPQSGTTKAALKLVKKIPHRIIMTGSPMWEPRHLYGQLRFLGLPMVPESSYTKFSQRFLRFSKYNRYVVEGYKNLEQLKARVSMVCLYRSKEECLDLPERVFVNIPVKLPTQTLRVYNDLVRDFQTTIGDKEIKLTDESVLPQLSALLQVGRGWLNESQKDPDICNHCDKLLECVEQEIKPYTSACAVVKVAPPPITHTIEDSPVLQQAVDLICEILDENPTNKVLLWFRSNETLRRAQQLFREARYKGEAPLLEDVTDSMGTEDLYDEESITHTNEDITLVGSSDYGMVVREFNNNPEVRVLFGQMKCGIGINLVAAAYTIYPEPTLFPEDYEQSLDRNHRAGQTKKVTVYRFIAQDTIDEGISHLLEEKVDLQLALTDPTFCDRCTAAGSCVLNMCDNPRKSGKRNESTCGLQGLIGRSRLKISAVSIPETQQDFDFIEEE